MSDFKKANLPILVERGVPPKLALQAVNILDRQNQGLLPCPLSGEELQVVRSAWQWMTAPRIEPTYQDKRHPNH